MRWRRMRRWAASARGGPCAARWAARCRCTSFLTMAAELTSCGSTYYGPLAAGQRRAWPRRGVGAHDRPGTPFARRRHATSTRPLHPLCTPLCAPSMPSAPPHPPSPIALPPLCARRPLRGRRRSHAQRAPSTSSTARSTRLRCCCRCRAATPPLPPPWRSSRLCGRSPTPSRSISRCHQPPDRQTDRYNQTPPRTRPRTRLHPQRQPPP